MPRPHILYKDGQVQRNVYPSELDAWLKEGWRLTPPSLDEPSDGEPEAVEPEPSNELLSINNASAKEISEALNGIGPSRASKIIEKRNSLDGFTDLSEIPFIEDEHKKLISL